MVGEKELNSIKMENEELYPEDQEHECEFIDGECACGKVCPQCNGEKKTTTDTFNGEHGQYESVCECSLE